MTDVHFLGEYTSLTEVWKKFPNGGGYGDYVIILGVRHNWDESTNSWGDGPGDVNPALPEVVNHDIDVQGTLTARDGIKTADYIPGEAGAHINHAGEAEFRSVDVDSLRVKDPVTGYMLILPDFIKKYKTELPPDWEEYSQMIMTGDSRFLVFDPLSGNKYYVTYEILKRAILAELPPGEETHNIEIIRTYDANIATDNNVLSASRTLEEISKAVAVTHSHSNKSLIDLIKIGDIDVLSILRIIDGKLIIDADVCSTGEISAHGIGETPGGGNVGYDRLDSWLDYIAGKTEGWVLSAMLGKNLQERITLMETKGSDKNYIYTQTIPAAVWTVSHGLGKYSSVTILDSAGTEVIGEVKYIDLNTVQITFSSEFSGKAILN